MYTPRYTLHLSMPTHGRFCIHHIKHNTWLAYLDVLTWTHLICHAITPRSLGSLQTPGTATLGPGPPYTTKHRPLLPHEQATKARPRAHNMPSVSESDVRAFLPKSAFTEISEGGEVVTVK